MSRRSFVPLVVAVLAAGCHHSISVPAAQMPRLNGASTNVTYGYQVSVRTETVQTVTRTDGTMAHVRGEFSATPVFRNPAVPRLTFRAPVESRIDGPNLVMAGGNRGPTPFALAQLLHVDVTTYDAQLTAALATLIGGLVALAAGGVTLAILFG